MCMNTVAVAYSVGNCVKLGYVSMHVCGYFNHFPNVWAFLLLLLLKVQHTCAENELKDDFKYSAILCMNLVSVMRKLPIWFPVVGSFLPQIGAAGECFATKHLTETEMVVAGCGCFGGAASCVFQLHLFKSVFSKRCQARLFYIRRHLSYCCFQKKL